MLENNCIARHEGRYGEAENLPEREVPGHDGQHNTHWLKGHVTSRGIGGDEFRRQKLLGVLGIVVADPCAFLHFGSTLRQWLAHLLGH